MMKKSLKISKKVLSVVLSVLMAMSVFVFAPAASAADGVTLKVTVTCDNALDLREYDSSHHLWLVVEQENEPTIQKVDVLSDLHNSGGFLTGDQIAKGKSVTKTFTIVSKVKSISIDPELEANTGSVVGLFQGSLGIKIEATIGDDDIPLASGRKTIEGLPEVFRKGNSYDIVSGNDFNNSAYPSYTVRFYNLDKKAMKTQTVTLGGSVSAPALPKKAADENNHYTVKWDKDSSAWEKVTASVSVNAVATGEEHAFSETKPAKDATCTENGYTAEYKCSVCGYVKKSTPTDAKGHKFGDWAVVTYSNCTKKGTEKRTCSVCGKEETRELGLASHSLVDVDAVAATCTKDGHTAYKKCENCSYTEGYEVIEAAGHVMGEWNITDKPSCEGDGVKRRDCANCDYYETDKVAPTGHTEVEIPKVDPKCGKIGWTAGVKCSVCGTVITEPKEIPALEHEWKETGRKDATCTEEGTSYQTCELCKATQTVTIPAQGHKIDTTKYVVDKKATCENPGQKSYHCSVCDAIDDSSIISIPARKHNYGKWDEVKAATCTEPGSQIRYCQNTSGTDEYEACTASETGVIGILGHDFSSEVVDDKYLKTSANCENDAVYYKSCSRCKIAGTETFEAEGSKLGHNFNKEIADDAHLKSPATCEEKAVYYYNCSRCEKISDKYTFEYGTALGHDYVGAVTSRPTADAKGLATYTCSRDASHVYTLEMDLADYSEFDTALAALEEIAKRDLNKDTRAEVDAAIKEAKKLSRNLIAGVKDQEYTDPLDQYKHDFGEQDLINAATAKLTDLIEKIEEAGEGALTTYYAVFYAWKTAENRADEAETYEHARVAYNMESDLSVFEGVGKPGSYSEGDYTYEFKCWNNTPEIVKGGAVYEALYSEGTFDKANYTEFDKAEKRANDIIDNNDLTQEVIDKINELISDGYKKDGSDYGITDQAKVDEATKALNDYLNSLDKNGDGKVDEDNLKHYTIRFLDEDGTTVLSTASLIKGATVTVPADPTKAADEHHTYKFAGWNPAVTKVDGAKDYEATYTAVNYTEYDEILDDIKDLDLKDDVKDAIKEITDVIDGGRNKAPLDPNTQEDVDKAVEAIKKLLDKDGDSEIDEDNYKHYTVKFIFKDKNAADVTDEKTNKNLRKGAKVTVPAIEKSFEVKTADSDKTYVFTGWNPENVEENVTKNATHTAQYKVVEYKDFNDIVDKVEDIDLNDETKKKIDDIIDEINNNKNDEDGDKNTQEDVDKAVEEIKKILDSDGDGEVDDDVLKEYTVTFKWHGGKASQTVVSGKAAVAPADPDGYYNTVKHYSFDKWDKEFSVVKSDLEVNAVYTDEVHSFKSVLTTRPEAKKDAKGVVTYTCGCGYSYTVDVNRADYDKYEAVRAELEEILKNVDLTDASRAEIEKVLKDNDIPRNYVDSKENGVDEQPLVDKATETLEAFLKDLKEKIDNKDEDVVKHYTVIFRWHDDSKTFTVVKGTKITAPTVGNYVFGGFTYEFLGWDKDVETVVTADATYTAQYTQPRSMDDVIEAEKKADEVIGNDDYYKDDQKKVEDAKKELEDYLDEKDVKIDEDGNVTNNPITKGSEEDAKITELVEKLNNAIDSANKNKAEREKNNKNTSGFLGWLVRLLILVRHLLGMVG